MRGEVRFLLFWLGRDSIGGGHIRIERSPSADAIEVLFGSDPARIPGRVNRWGFGREVTRLNPPDPSSTFDGLMRYSPEQSLDQARGNSRSGADHLYHAVHCVVRPREASTELRLIELQDTLDYRSAATSLDSLFRTVSARPPSTTRTIRHDAAPLGFLSTLHSLTRNLATAPDRVQYIYNARPYLLRILRRTASASSVSADFSVTNLDKGTQTLFSLDVPQQGPRAGIPTRITISPRWWLRLRLDLTGSEP